MEELDEYMNEIGWRPKPDTLAKISEKNLWVFDRFIKGQDQHVMGLSVFILKERALERDLLWPITDAFKKDGLKIVKVDVLSKQEKVRAEKHIRGGHWADSTGSVNGLLPAATIITLDPKCASSSILCTEFERIQVSQRKKRYAICLIAKMRAASFIHLIIRMKRKIILKPASRTSRNR